MNNSFSKRRLAENEVYFRKVNEQVEAQLASIKDLATEEGKQHHIYDDASTLFHFYCECSDENCRKRIAISLNDYNTHHKQNDQFIIIPGHEVPIIEKVVHKRIDFWTVRKIIPVPEAPSRLNKTPINNV